MAHPNDPGLSAVTIMMALLLALVAGFPVAHALGTQPLVAEAQIQIVGLELQPAPGTQAVPKNTGTTVKLPLVHTDDTAVALPPLPDTSLFPTELRGPSFSAWRNEPFLIPPLTNVRTVNDSEILLQGNPDTVLFKVIDNVLVKPQSAEEVQQCSIFIDKTTIRCSSSTWPLSWRPIVSESTSRMYRSASGAFERMTSRGHNHGAVSG